MLIWFATCDFVSIVNQSFSDFYVQSLHVFTYRWNSLKREYCGDVRTENRLFSCELERLYLGSDDPDVIEDSVQCRTLWHAFLVFFHLAQRGSSLHNHSKLWGGQVFWGDDLHECFQIIQKDHGAVEINLKGSGIRAWKQMPLHGEMWCCRCPRDVYVLSESTSAGSSVIRIHSKNNNLSNRIQRKCHFVSVIFYCVFESGNFSVTCPHVISPLPEQQRLLLGFWMEGRRSWSWRRSLEPSKLSWNPCATDMFEKLGESKMVQYITIPHHLWRILCECKLFVAGKEPGFWRDCLMFWSFDMFWW